MEYSQARERRTLGRAVISLIIVAAVAIGFAIQRQDGEYTPLAMALITIALLATFSAVGISRHILQDNHPGKWVNAILAAGLTLELFTVFIQWPAGVDQARIYRFLNNRILYTSLVGICGFLVLLGYIDARPARRWWFPALLIFHSALGFWMVRSSPDPHIDVWVFQQDGANALLHGRNPYDAGQVQFPDIYDSTLPGHQRVYGEGMVADGRLKFGFPYPPLSLYCSTLGVWLGGDTRYAQAITLTLAGLFIGYCGSGRLPKLAAALLLFTPRAFFIIGRAWTEPFVVMFLAATIFCAARNLRWLVPIALGLLLVSKQYLVLAIPLSFLLLRDFRWRSPASWRRWAGFLALAGIVAAAVTLPLALLNPSAFWLSTVTVQKQAPFRWDALSYLVWLGLNFDSKYTTWIGLAFVMAALSLLWAIWKARSGAAGFALALAMVYLPFIAFNKQAFCNYYFFVIACLCCALGVPAADAPQPATTASNGN